jgi:hypothetical protein
MHAPLTHPTHSPDSKDASDESAQVRESRGLERGIGKQRDDIAKGEGQDEVHRNVVPLGDPVRQLRELLTSHCHHIQYSISIV